MPGQCFGEGALLLPSSVSDSTYRAAASGCTLLEVPSIYFYQMVDKDVTLVAALHLKLLHKAARLAAILAHPRAHATFAAFLHKVACDENALDAYEGVHAYARLRNTTPLAAAARVVGESIINDFFAEDCTRPVQHISDAVRQRVSECIICVAVSLRVPPTYTRARHVYVGAKPDTAHKRRCMAP